MLHLLWGLLNIGLFLFFIAICFKATKLIREKFGLFASVVFVFGLLSFAGNSHIKNDNIEPNSNQIKTWKFSSDDSLSRNETYSIRVDLEKTLVSKYQLGITYTKDSEGQQSIPMSAYSSTTGFISGTNWKPTSIIINRTAENKQLEYFVNGVVEWKLFGATIYSQQKNYKGLAFTR